MSYTGNEPNVIRMRFDRKINRQGKRATKGITRRFLMRSLRIYRGFKRRRKLIEFRRVLG